MRFARLLGGVVLAGALVAPAEAASSGEIDTVAGNGERAYSGDGGSARQAAFFEPRDVAIGASGTLYVADTRNHRIRRVGPDGRVTTLAGTGTAGAGGLGGPAASAQLHWPQAVALDEAETVLYVADTSNHRVLAVDLAALTISAVAGMGTGGFGGDGGPATEAVLLDPKGVAVSPSGALVIADTGNDRLRVVSKGVINTLAGNGKHGFAGDGGPATAAALASPRAVALGPDGALYVADDDNHRVRRIRYGTITTVAGTGTAGYSGDGGPATAAGLANPRGVAVDGAGNLYIADSRNHAVRVVDAGGTIATVAGNGREGFKGDGGPAADARLFSPRAVTAVAGGAVYVSDSSNGRIRMIAPT